MRKKVSPEQPVCDTRYSMIWKLAVGLSSGSAILRTFAALACLLQFSLPLAAQGGFYSRSYALVVGIDDYSAGNWPRLQRAVSDAKGMEQYLLSQGFTVTALYNRQASKTRILSVMLSDLARRVEANDRVLIYFAGHGYTETLGGKDWGYIVPQDASNDPASYISMEELRAQSEKMGTAKHQLFIMDACYGGLLGTRGAVPIDPAIPGYLTDVTSRVARQMITAGGKDQEAVDGLFTDFLLEALRDSKGDLNRDGYITFNELVTYLLPRASNHYQTPSAASLQGHGLGEFVFRSGNAAPLGAAQPGDSAETTRGSNPPDQSGQPANQTPVTHQASPAPLFRAQPLNNLSVNDKKIMVKKLHFYDAYSNDKARGFANDYQLTGDELVLDRASGLMWQQAGLQKQVNYPTAQSYITELNEIAFGGYSDWRLPTLEEAMSLMEPQVSANGAYIDAIFDKTQRFIWTADFSEPNRAWLVSLGYGHCSDALLSTPNFVRAVRVGP